MLIVDDVAKTYPGGIRALRGVSLRCETGLFGLLGPNGAGKSTLMRILATLEEPDQGRVVLDGRDANADPRDHRRRLGYLPQEFGVYPGVSAQHLLDHLAQLKGLADRRQRHEQVAALLQRTHLFPFRKQAVATFSGGMRRRFGIAQALLGDPRLVIVDEPTAGLDPEERHRLHDLLVEIGQDRVVVLSTHIVEDVRQLCPRMAILSLGQLLLDGEPGKLVDQLAGRVWARAVDRDQVPSYRRRHTVLSTHLQAGRTMVRILAEDRPEAGFEPQRVDLEDVYFSALPPRQAA